ncbi:probable glutamate receptor [Ischnura elegans]|uniref:probable glutamate receptor n=1 Tax=Ischnura elegans TaxID=197161 RepID=UPI001ED8B2DC|nr:probable glutamate receptor [Ischnura elegans]
MSRRKAGGKPSYFWFTCSTLIALVANPAQTITSLNVTSHQSINENARQSMIQLVNFMKKQFFHFNCILVNINFLKEEIMGWNQSENNEENFASFPQFFVSNDSSIWIDEMSPHESWGRRHSESQLINISSYRNMLGVNVRVTTLYNPPMSMLTTNGSSKILTGYIGDIWHDIQDILKFTYSMHTSEEDNWSIGHHSECCQPNEGRIECNAANCRTWVDLVGLLTRGEADVVATPLTPTAGRLQAIHFSSPILFSSEQLFIRLKAKPPVSYEFYLQPFSSYMWTTITIIFICILPMMHALFSWLSPSSHYLNIPSDMLDGLEHKNYHDLPKSSKIVDSISHWLMESFGICCQQGLQFVPQSQAVRLSLYVTMLSSSVIYNVYSGSLTSFLAVERQLKPQFSSIEGLLQSARELGLSIGVLENSSLISILSEHSAGPYKEIWDIIRNSESGLVPTRFEGFQRACAEEFVFFTLKASYEGYRKFLQPCELYGIPEPNLNTYVGMSIAKGYEYADLIDSVLLQMNEVGMLQRQRLKWWPPYDTEEYTYAAAQKDAVETGTSDPIMKITLRHITFALKLMLIGIGLALLIFICETIFAWQGKKRNPKSSLENHLLPAIRDQLRFFY